MKVQKILPLVTQTAQALSLPEETVAKIVAFQFNNLKEHLYNPPLNASTVQLEQLGKFRVNLSSINREINNLIPLLRTSDSPELIAKFRYFWQLRQDAIKENRLRDYKKRFGTWHN